MYSVFRLLFACVLLSLAGISEASRCGNINNSQGKCQIEKCCSNMGGVQYCDSSAGRLVCQNGYYSSCYCTRHAIMDLHNVEGCCLWQGGVMTIDETGLVICNSGGVSELCTLQIPTEPVAAW